VLAVAGMNLYIWNCGCDFVEEPVIELPTSDEAQFVDMSVVILLIPVAANVAVAPPNKSITEKSAVFL